MTATITSDFAQRTRTRIAEARAALTKLRDFGKETVKQLERIRRQQASDQERVTSKLSAIADDIVDKLPEEASDADAARAYELQEQINDLAGSVEEVSVASSAVDDLGSLGDMIRDAYAALKESETQLGQVERLAVKLGI